MNANHAVTKYVTSPAARRKHHNLKGTLEPELRRSLAGEIQGCLIQRKAKSSLPGPKWKASVRKPPSPECNVIRIRMVADCHLDPSSADPAGPPPQVYLLVGRTSSTSYASIHRRGTEVSFSQSSVGCPIRDGAAFFPYRNRINSRPRPMELPQLRSAALSASLLVHFFLRGWV